ncbi:MAG: alpha/beta hydrolase [Betaproteobacteria bacterium]|nr:alpha/beta hydrolase [Betaproteobacteria bacterium]
MTNPATHHPANEKDLATVEAVRQQSAPFKGAMSRIDARPGYDAMIEAIPMATGITYEKASVGSIAGVWCRPNNAQASSALLYLHGGGYMVGSAFAYRHFAGQFAARTGIVAFVPDYRLAPENSFPAAVQDVHAAYRGLMEAGFTKICLIGDSAGGGLSLITLSLAHDDASKGIGIKPKCCVVMSPLTDLALTGASHDTKAIEDPFLTKEATQLFVDAYLGQQDPKQPTASPLYGQLSLLAPTQIHVGTSEVLLDDSVAYAAAANRQGGNVSLHVWDRMPHVFPSRIDMLTAAEDAMFLMAEYIKKHMVS